MLIDEAMHPRAISCQSSAITLISTMIIAARDSSLAKEQLSRNDNSEVLDLILQSQISPPLFPLSRDAIILAQAICRMILWGLR